MGIARGTNIVRDGLVYGYDTGYGIADPGASTRFYKGKPTTNIASGDAFIHATSSGSAGSCVDAPEKGPGWKKVTITAIGTNFRVVQFGSYPSLTANITYSSSFEVDWGNMRGKGYAITQDGTGGGTRNYFINGSYASGVTGVDINSSLLDGHFGMNIVKTSNHVHVPFIYNTGNTSTTGRNDYFYYKEYQQEVGTIPTPYVDGTRSSTASLIDLKRNNSIDVSNVSFDSTGQPTFDGTNDVINLPNDLGYGTTSVSVFAWYKINGSPANGYHIICGDTYLEMSIHSSSTYLRNGVETTNGRYVSNNGNQTLNDGNYHYYGFTFDGSTKRAYIDGVQVGTQSVTGTLTNTFSGRKIGAFSGGYYANGDLPVYKVYNKVLTSAEVTQNYKAYKNRFNI